MAKELELKLLVTADEFVRCRKKAEAVCGKSGDSYVQVNYYFDTPDFCLAQNKCMLRARRKKNALFLQFKQKRTRTCDGMFLCDEGEQKISKLPRTVDPSAYFPGAPAAECALLGDLVTHRTDFSFPGAVLSLDENIYLGKTDFEIEIEGDQDAIRAVAQSLGIDGIAAKGCGKASRFRKAYSEYYSDQVPFEQKGNPS